MELPAPEDPGYGYQNKKHLCLTIPDPPGFAQPWSSRSCIASAALSSSWDRHKLTLGLLGHSSGSQSSGICQSFQENQTTIGVPILPSPASNFHSPRELRIRCSASLSPLLISRQLLGLPSSHSWKFLNDLCHESSKPDSKDFCFLHTGDLSASFAVLCSRIWREAGGNMAEHLEDL